MSNYPTRVEDTDLKKINSLKRKFKKYHIGLSDHTNDIDTSLASVPLGIVAIEKHFILDKSFKGPDSDFSMDPKQLKSLVLNTHKAWQSMGNSEFKRANVEESSLAFRRSIYFTDDLKKGDLITRNNIRRIRPGFGLKPKHFHEIIGKKLAHDVEMGDPVLWDCIEDR